MLKQQLGNIFFFTLMSAPLLAGANELFPQIDEKIRDNLRQSVTGPYGFEDHIEAKVWLADMSARLRRTLPNEQYRMDLLKTIHAEATRAGLRPELVLAVIQVESNFDQFAISVAGARGLMQVMPFWIKEIGHPGDNLFKTEVNLRYGTTILKYYLDMENGDLWRALARYNGSLGQTKYPRRVISTLRTRWFEH
jgi:soluble lytic murein transglycosylase-like protein